MWQKLSKIKITILAAVVLSLVLTSCSKHSVPKKDKYCKKEIAKFVNRHWTKDYNSKTYKADSMLIKVLAFDADDATIKNCIVGMDKEMFIHYFGVPSHSVNSSIRYILDGYGANAGRILIIDYDMNGKIIKYDLVHPID